MKNICTVSNSSSKTIDSINDITQDLNQETAQVLSQEEQNKMFDASFLFPKSQHTALIQKHTKKISKKTVSTVKDQEQIFKVWKIPKIAFSMISRQNLARSNQEEEEVEEQAEDEVPSTTFDERKAAFGDKRDDLFYKTIGRDVRKYIQESFQSHLGEKNLKHVLKNQTFYREVQEFFKAEILPYLSSDSDVEKVLCCVATLVSYQGYSSYCDKDLSEISLKVHDSLHNFTKVKLINLCQLPEFKDVFRYYSKEIQNANFSRFKSHRTMKTNVRGYKYAFNDILKHITNTL